MEQEKVTHTDLQAQLSHLDRRVLVLETQQTAIRHDVQENAKIAKAIGERVDAVYRAIGELNGRQTFIIWVIGAGIPLIAALEVWSNFR